jgi:hypothetical protein
VDAILHHVKSMQSLILISIIVATVAVPVLASRDRFARRGLQRTLAVLLGFNALYLVVLLNFFARYFIPVWSP